MRTSPNRVIIRRRAAKETTESGRIFLPSQAQRPEMVGTVLAVGSAVTCCEPGDNVLWDPRKALPVEAPDGAVVVANEEDLLVIWE